MIKKLLVLENLSINKMIPSSGEGPSSISANYVPDLPAPNFLDSEPSPSPTDRRAESSPPSQPSEIGEKSFSPPPPPPPREMNPSSEVGADAGNNGEAATGDNVDSEAAAEDGGKNKEGAGTDDESEAAAESGGENKAEAGANVESEAAAGAGGKNKEGAGTDDESEAAAGAGGENKAEAGAGGENKAEAGAGGESEAEAGISRPAGAGGDSEAAAKAKIDQAAGVGSGDSETLTPREAAVAADRKAASTDSGIPAKSRTPSPGEISPQEPANSLTHNAGSPARMPTLRRGKIITDHTSPTIEPQRETSKTPAASQPLVLSSSATKRITMSDQLLRLASVSVDLNDGNSKPKTPNFGYEAITKSSSGHNLTSETKLHSTNNPFSDLLSDQKSQHENIKNKLIQHLNSITQKFHLNSDEIASITAELNAIDPSNSNYNETSINNLIIRINAIELPDPNINQDNSVANAPPKQPLTHSQDEIREFNQSQSITKTYGENFKKSLTETRQIYEIVIATQNEAKRIAKTKLFASLRDHFLGLPNNFTKSLDEDLQLLHENGYLDLYSTLRDPNADNNAAPTLQCLSTYRGTKSTPDDYIFKTNSFNFDEIEEIPANYAYYLYLRAKQYEEDYKFSTKKSITGFGDDIPILEGITPPNSKLEIASLDNCLYSQQAQDIDEFVRLYRPAADAYFNKSTQIRVMSITNNNTDGAQLKFGECYVKDFSCIQYNSKTPKSTILFKEDFDEIVIYKTKLAERLMLFDGIKRAMNKRGVFIEGIDFDQDYTLTHIDQKIKKALDRYNKIMNEPYCQDIDWQPNPLGALTNLPQDFVGNASLVFNPPPQVNSSNQSPSNTFQDNLKKLQEKTFAHDDRVSPNGSPRYHSFGIDLQKKYLHEADILLQNKIIHKNRSKLSRDSAGNFLDYDDNNIKSFIDISRHHNDSTGITTVNIEIGGELTEDGQKFLQICIGEKKDVFQQFKFKPRAQSSRLQINESEEIIYFVKRKNEMIGAKYHNGSLVAIDPKKQLDSTEKNKILKAIKTTKVKIKEITNDGKVDNAYKISPKSKSSIIKDKTATLIKTKTIKPQPKQNSYSLNLKTSSNQTIDKDGFIQIGNLYKTSFALTKRKEKLYDFYLHKDQNNQLKLFYRRSQAEIDDLEKQAANQQLDTKEKIKISRKLCKLKEYREYNPSSLKSGNLTMILGNQNDKFLAHPRHYLRDDQERKFRFSDANLKFSSQEVDIKKIISQKKHNGWKIFGGYGGNIKKQFSLEVFDPKNQEISHLILTPKTKGFLNSATKIKITESEKSHHAKPNNLISQPRGTNFFSAIRDSFRG